MTPDDIAADRAVIDAATDGPWTAIGQGVVHDTGACNCGPGGLNGMHEPYCGAGLLADASVDDAAFIAAARDGWPRALDALEVMADAVLDEMARAEKAEAEVARVRARCEYVDILDASEYDAGRMAALDAVLAALDGGESA